MRNVDEYRTPEIVDQGSVEELTKDCDNGFKPEASITTVVWGTPPAVIEDDSTDEPVI